MHISYIYRELQSETHGVKFTRKQEKILVAPILHGN